MDLDQKECPPSTFGLFANGAHAAKHLNQSLSFLAAILSTEETSRSLFPLAV